MKPEQATSRAAAGECEPLAAVLDRAAGDEWTAPVLEPTGRCACGADLFWSARECDPCSKRRLALTNAMRASKIPARFEWATFDAPELRARVRDAGAIERAKTAVERGLRAFVFVGPAGVGKTTLAICTGRACGARDVQPVHFADAIELSTARAQTRLGDGEAIAVRRAIDAPILILDELGRGLRGQWDAQTDVIFRRHNDNSVTIYTAGAGSRSDLQKLLDDDGLARRVLEGAAIFEMSPARRQA